MPSFNGVPVLVTGAGRGIGKRLSIGFAAKGARVALVARSKAELDLCHLEIEHAGGSALRIRADVTDFEQMSAAVERTRVHFNRGVQVLICAAGIQGPIGPFVESAPKVWADLLQTNLIGVLQSLAVALSSLSPAQVTAAERLAPVLDKPDPERGRATPGTAPRLPQRPARARQPARPSGG